MTEQLDLEDWLRDNPANSDDTDNSLKNNEKWKNEELEEGNYYIKDKYGNFLIAQYLPDYDYDHQDGYALDGYRWYALGFDYDDFEQDSVEEVLAPIPSYEGMQLIALKIDVISEKIAELSVENQQLKELLLECRKILEKETYDLMVKKIDNAIGEKK